MGFIRIVAWCLLPVVTGACAPKVFYPGDYQGASEAERKEAYEANRIKNTGNFLFSYSVGATSYSSDMMWPLFQSSEFLSDETRESFSSYKTTYYIALGLAFPTGFLSGAAAATGDGGLIAAGLGTLAVFVGVIAWSESVFRDAVRKRIDSQINQIDISAAFLHPSIQTLHHYADSV